MQQDVLIQAHSLSREFGGLRAVDNVSFELRRGEVLGLLGPNDAGKSTTMQMICGCLAPSSGSVSIGGHDLQDEPVSAKRELGYLPELPPLYADLRVGEYLRFCARLHRLSPAQVAPALERVIESCGLGEVRRRLIGQLSKGMQQRVGIAQALVHNPSVVVLDEPTAGLDPLQIRDIRELIMRIGHDHAVLLSSHILPEVEAVCARVLIMQQGRIAYDARLGEDTRSRWLRLGLEASPQQHQIAELDGVIECRRDTDDYWLLRLEPAPGRAADLLASAVSKGWRPSSLTPQSSVLEQVFIELTTGEAEP